MKNRNALSNLFYVIILLALAGFLVVEFGVVKLAASTQKLVGTLLLAVAILMVAAVEFLFPILANKVMLKNNRYRLMVIIKAVLFAASALVLFLYEPFHVIKNMPVALALFVVFYFIQFFISLDPKVETKKPKSAVPKTAAGPSQDHSAKPVPQTSSANTSNTSGTSNTFGASGTSGASGASGDVPGSIDDIGAGDSDEDIEDFLFDIESDD